jgi:hypothetical protein
MVHPRRVVARGTLVLAALLASVTAARAEALGLVAGAEWALAAAAIVGGLIALELALRLAHDVPLLSTANFIVKAPTLLHGLAVLTHDDLLGWRLKDGLRLPVGALNGGSVTTGRYGLRMNDDRVREPPAGAILAVGDSFTVSGTGDADTWPAQLERLLGTPVLNAACGGWGVDQMVLRAEQLIPVLRPAALIVGILVPHDLHRSAYRLFGGSHKPWFRLEGDLPKLQGVPVPMPTAASLALSRWQTILGHCFLVHRLLDRIAPQAWRASHEQSYRTVCSHDASVGLSCRLLDRLAKFARPRGIRTVLALFWGHGEVSGGVPGPEGAVLSAHAEACGFEVVDLYGPLRDVALRDADAFQRLWLVEGGAPGHPSAAGNATAAAAIRTVLEATRRPLAAEGRS